MLAVQLGCGMPASAGLGARVLADSGMAQARGGRSLLATMVGYVLVAVIAYIVVRMMVGTIFWLTRTIIVVVIVGGLLTLYLNLKLPKE